MTNEELKKKIVEILEETEYEWTEEKNGYILQIFYDKLADALIAAGLGDVSSHRVFVGKDGIVKQLYSGEEVEQIVKEREEYKHRAARAERALLLACANVVKDEKDDVDIELLVRVVYDKYLKQAERELAEEGK